MPRTNQPFHIGRRALIGATGSALMAAPAVRAQGKTGGVALVIGNSKYQWEAPLPNVQRDAPDVVRRFKELGLKTELLQNLGREAMRQAVEKFIASASGANLAAFYFAGHGVSWERNTYLVPVDSDLGTSNAVANLIPFPTIRNKLGEAASRLLVLDACRNNPADGWRQKVEEHRASGRGDLNTPGSQDPPNSLVLFSTIPGRAALDGAAGQNSPFAAAFLRQLAQPPIDLQALPVKLRRDLLIATAGRQILWGSNSFRASFTIGGPVDARAPAQAASADPRRVVELVNGYAFAKQNNLPMPAGLIAYKPPAGARDVNKIGSFRFTGYNQEPSLLVVLSIEDPQNVELLLTHQDTQRQVRWRFLRGTLSGNAIDIDFPQLDLRLAFHWNDPDTGRVTMLPQGAPGSSNRVLTGTFTRLDG